MLRTQLTPPRLPRTRACKQGTLQGTPCTGEAGLGQDCKVKLHGSIGRGWVADGETFTVVSFLQGMAKKGSSHSSVEEVLTLPAEGRGHKVGHSAFREEQRNCFPTVGNMMIEQGLR